MAFSVILNNAVPGFRRGFCFGFLVVNLDWKKITKGHQKSHFSIREACGYFSFCSTKIKYNNSNSHHHDGTSSNNKCQVSMNVKAALASSQKQTPYHPLSPFFFFPRA